MSVSFLRPITSLRLIDGTAAAPSLAFASDPNTGVFNAGADILGFATGGTEGMRLNASQRLLLGTNTDSSNGRIQLTTHTANTGGIGFGTDMALHRDSAGGLTLDTSAGAVGMKFSRALVSGAILGQIYFDTALGFIGTTGGHPFHLRSNGTIALTVDTSLRTILAGALRLSNTAVASGAVVNTHTVTVQDSTGTTYRLLCLV